MPSPRAAKIVSACAAGKASARPSEAPIKGAVQGEAMTTARMPDKNALTDGFLASSMATLPGTNWPNSNKPAKLRPITVNSTASAATTAGDCS